MLTPVDVQNKIFKGGIGYDKRDVESFLKDVSTDYETLYRSNVELNDKISTLNENLQHYRSIEDSMQKALTISEKTAEETINAANDKVRQINIEAEKRAESILEEAKEELKKTKQEIHDLQQQYAKFKEQYTKILSAQLQMMNEDIIHIDLGEDFEGDTSYHDSNFGFHQDSTGGLGDLGGLGNVGGYGGDNSHNDRFERTNQEPTINRTSLNMDPFTDAMNGGGRFSKQTGKGFNGNSNKKKDPQQGSTNNKTSLNIKDKKNDSTKVHSSFKTGTAKRDTSSMNSTGSTNNTASVKDTASAHSTVSMNNTASAKDTAFIHNTVSADNTTSVKDPVSVHNTVSTVDTLSTNHTSSTQPNTVANEGQPVSNNKNVAHFEQKEVQNTLLKDKKPTPNTVGNLKKEDVMGTVSKSSPLQNTSEKTLTGEVEYKIDESVMLESEDDQNEGFHFISDSEDEDPSVTIFVESEMTATYSGEVEDRINESTMLGSEDNLDEGFNFLVGNEDEEDDIPIIFADAAASISTDKTIPSSISEDEAASAASIPTDTISSSDNSEDILEGDIEEKHNRSHLIGNADDEENEFHFI